MKMIGKHPPPPRYFPLNAVCVRTSGCLLIQYIGESRKIAFEISYMLFWLHMDARVNASVRP